MFVRPVRILDIRNLKELIRIRAAHSQSRTDTFAVLLLALEANGLGLVLLPRLVSIERVVSVTGFNLRRWTGGGTYSMLSTWFGSFQPAAAMQAKRATRVKRTVRYFIFGLGLVSGWVSRVP